LAVRLHSVPDFYRESLLRKAKIFSGEAILAFLLPSSVPPNKPFSFNEYPASS
jgi:hypothetical protein